jgi:hypothetical protein
MLNIVSGATVEVNLPPQDSDTGQFYIGKFTVGSYEILCNVSGIHANNCGWKIIVGKNWGGASVQLTELHNHLGGRFFAVNESSSVFHLWWLSDYSNKQQWTPRLKVEYQAGSYSLSSPIAFSSSAVEVEPIIYLRRSNIGIGTKSPAFKLDVNGTIRAKEIKVEAQTADFVFEPEYQLRSLDEVESFILDNKHLPDIPSAAAMEEKGVNLAEMNKLLLMKVEELTLYMIELRNEINALKTAQNDASK